MVEWVPGYAVADATQARQRLAEWRMNPLHGLTLGFYPHEPRTTPVSLELHALHLTYVPLPRTWDNTHQLSTLAF
jgi:hypothetical protein